MKQPTFELLLEAYRRWTVLHSSEQRDVSEQWVGLGYPSEYKPAVSDGLMRPISGQTPRIMGWYGVTQAGATLLKRWKAAGVVAPSLGFSYEPTHYNLARSLV
jgi:hypothetical protein